MKLQRTTLVLLLLAILLGGFVYFYEIRWKSQQEQVKKKQQQLFSFKEDDVKILKITTPSETITLERSQESNNSKWLMKSPETVPANDGTVAFLLDLLEKEETERTLTTTADKLSEFGLKQPQATIDITLNNQKTHKLVLGKHNFDNRFVYAQVDKVANKPDKNIQVVLISKNFENAIKRSTSEWKAVDNTKTTTTPSPKTTPKNSTPAAIPTIKPIPINPTPKTIQDNSTTKPTPTPTSTPTPTPTSTPKPTPTSTPKPTTTPTSTPGKNQ